MKHTPEGPRQAQHTPVRMQHRHAGREEEHMHQLASQQQHEQRYHRCSTSACSNSSSSCTISPSTDLTCTRHGGSSTPERRRRHRRRDEGKMLDGQQGCGSSSSSSSSSRRSRRRRQGTGLATVLFASSTAAAAASAATAVSYAAAHELASSGMGVSASMPLHRRQRRDRPPTAFVASAAATGMEPVRRWAAAGCRRLAGLTHQDGAAGIAAAVKTSFLRGGLRGGHAGGLNDGSSSRGLRMVASGFSGEFMPPDDSWKRSRRTQQQEEEEEEGTGSPLSSQRSDTSGRMESVQGDEEEDEIYTWTPKPNGQGSWDSRGTGTLLSSSSNEEVPVWRVDLKRGVYTGDVKIKQPLGLDLTECKGGVCVSKVREGCSAERQGVRPGDRIVATSATLGDVLWEKNTVDGILSAVGTRLVFSNTVTLRVERALDAQQLAAARFRESVTQTYEVTLQRPPGLILEQLWDSAGQAESVIVAGIVPGSPAEASGVVECGDKVVAVSSSIGNIMWPYRQLEGALSAIERHLGNTINIRFERTVQMGAWTDPSSTDTERTIESTLEVFRKSDVAAATSAAAGPLAAAAAAAKNAGFDVDGGRRSGRQVTGGGTVTAGGAPGRGVAAVSGGGAQDDEARTIVLERCGALARSYGAKKQAIAVDNLLSSMVKAGVQMNARFLNNALIAYLACGEPHRAVDTFHAVTGIIWPEYAPWPDAFFSVRRRVATRNKQPQQPAAAAAAAATNGSTIESARTTGGDAPAAATSTAPADAHAVTKPKFPEEFRLLMAGPSEDDADALEASSWEGTGGERFLQMRTVAEQAAEHLSNRFREGGAVAAAAAAAAVGMEGPLKRPALGEYVGECRPNGMLVATVVKAHGRRRRLDDACRVVLKMADWGLKPDVAVFNSLAAAAVWNGRMDLALQVVLGGMMHAWGVVPNQMSFNTVMDAYARQGNVNNVVKIYNYMQGEGISPDVITTTILVKAQVSSGDVDAGARTLIEMMKASNLKDKLDAFPFNTIIKGLMKTLEWEKAMDLFRGMRYNNVKPNLMTFNTLIAGLNRAHVPTIALELYEEMMEMGGVAPDVYTYSSVVTAYARLGDVENAVKVLSDMAKSGVKPNRFTLSSVMQACIKGKQPRAALQVFEQLTRSGGVGVRSDEVIATLVVQAHAMLGEFDEAFQAITAMGKSGQDNKVSFNHLIKECVLAGEWNKASEAITRMVHQGKGGKGVRFDHNTFNAVSEIPRGYDGTEAAAWPRLTFLMKTKEMVVERKWEYSSTLYLAILYECVARQDYAMANMVVEDRKAGMVYVHPRDRVEVDEVEEKISFKMEMRPIETVWIS